MTDHKFTDERIIRCLNECYGKENVVAHIVDQGADELVTLGRLLDIINRQKAEIEMLSKARENCLEIIELGERRVLEVGAKSIKEFAERLKEGMRDLSKWQNGDATFYLVGESFIDRLAKEMTEADSYIKDRRTITHEERERHYLGKWVTRTEEMP